MSHRFTFLLFICLFVLILSGHAEGHGTVAPTEGRTHAADFTDVERTYSLPEVVVNPKKRQVLRLMGYVREYSTLTTYADTVFLFREKTVDFMIPTAKAAKKFKGWTQPRVLASKSYYHFTDAYGLDSVSNYFGQYFSWADWVGITDRIEMPLRLNDVAAGCDTVMADRYGPVAVWRKEGDRATFETDIRRDSTAGKWLSDFGVYMCGKVDFEKFRLRYDFTDISGGLLLADNISRVTIEIESNGRGRDLPRFLHAGTFDVSTCAEIYITDRKYMSLADARKWHKEAPRADEIGILALADVPELLPEIRELVERVNNIDHRGLRAGARPNEKYALMKDRSEKKSGGGLKDFLKSGTRPKRNNSAFPSRGM